MNLDKNILMTWMTPLGATLLSHFLASVNIHTYGPVRVIINKPYLDIQVAPFASKEQELTLYLGCGHFYALRIPARYEEDKLYDVVKKLFIKELYPLNKGDNYDWAFI